MVRVTVWSEPVSALIPGETGMNRVIRPTPRRLGDPKSQEAVDVWRLG
jgi:hypothetical protein